MIAGKEEAKLHGMQTKNCEKSGNFKFKLIWNGRVSYVISRVIVRFSF
jgi:hypothetical protein